MSSPLPRHSTQEKDSDMLVNEAAWLNAPGTRLEVGPAPYTHPADDELVVRGHAVAVNPLDWTIQYAGKVFNGWIKTPFVLGADVAGEVVEVGKDVTRFKPGDRVLALTEGTDKDSNSAARGAFQTYSVVLERLTSPLPSALSYEEGAVVPLAAATAACALFQPEFLALAPPSAHPARRDQTVLVWGGSTSVGSAAIQLAVAAGYDVLTTASPRNFDHVRRLGASQVFDYASPTVVSDIIRALQGVTVAGAVAVPTGSAKPTARVLAHATGTRFLAMASGPVSFSELARDRRRRWLMPRLLLQMGTETAVLQLRCRVRGIRTTFIWGTNLKNNEVGKAVFEDYLPAALADARYQAVPQPLVVGSGLGSIQAGLDTQVAGVSARKVVVTL